MTEGAKLYELKPRGLEGRFFGGVSRGGAAHHNGKDSDQSPSSGHQSGSDAQKGKSRQDGDERGRSTSSASSDGEMQADTALGENILAEDYPWVDLPGGPNVLVFPDLTSGNIGYKLVQRLAGAEVIGPITCGMAAPVHVLQRHSDLNDIIHLTALTVVQAQQR